MQNLSDPRSLAEEPMDETWLQRVNPKELCGVAGRICAACWSEGSKSRVLSMTPWLSTEIYQAAMVV